MSCWHDTYYTWTSRSELRSDCFNNIYSEMFAGSSICFASPKLQPGPIEMLTVFLLKWRLRCGLAALEGTTGNDNLLSTIVFSWINNPKHVFSVFRPTPLPTRGNIIEIRGPPGGPTCGEGRHRSSRCFAGRSYHPPWPPTRPWWPVPLWRDWTNNSAWSCKLYPLYKGRHPHLELKSQVWPSTTRRPAESANLHHWVPECK